MNLTIEATPPPSHPDSPPEPLPHNKEGLVKFALNAHRQFDENQWKNNPSAQINLGQNQVATPSYHNHNHIDAMIRVTKALLLASKTGQDPLTVNEQLDIWNNQHPEQVRLTLEDLETALKIASACHDLGNITQSDGLQLKSGELRLNYAKKYETAPGTADIETRSSNITEKLVDRFFTTPEDKAKITHLKPLIRHLIMQTVFNPQIVDSGQPFWQFMQYSDQIGTYFFPDQPRELAIAGILNEMRVRGDPPPNLAGFLNFPEERAQALIPDQDLRREITTILTTSGGNEGNMMTKGIFENPDRQVEYLPDITALITSH